MNWETILTVLGICVAFSGPFMVNKMFPSTAKAIKPKPSSVYLPHHIDEYGDVIMTKRIKTRV